MYQTFDTQSIVGTKQSANLIGPPFEIDVSTKPTNDETPVKIKAKKQKKAKQNNKSDDHPDSDSSLDLTASPLQGAKATGSITSTTEDGILCLDMPSWIGQLKDKY